METKQPEWQNTKIEDQEYLKLSELPVGQPMMALVKSQTFVERPKAIWKNGTWADVVNEKGEPVMKLVLRLEMFPKDGKERSKPEWFDTDWSETFGSRSLLGQLKMIALAQPTQKLESTATKALWLSFTRSVVGSKNRYEVKEIPSPL